MESDTHEPRHEPDTLRRDGGSAQDKSNWKGIFAFTKTPHLYALIPAVTFSVAAGLLQPTMAIVLGKFFNNFSEYAAGRIDGATLMKDCLIGVYALLGLGPCTLLLKGGMFVCWVKFGEMQAKSVRELLFSSLLARDIEWFDVQSTGMPTSLSQMHIHIQAVRLGTSQPLGLSVSALFQALSSVGLAFHTNWRLTLVVLSTIPVMCIGMALLSRPLQKYIDYHNEKLTAATRLANNFISNILLVKCFNTHVQEGQSYAVAVEEAAQLCHKASFFRATQVGYVRFISTVMFLQGFWYGGAQIHSGKTNTGRVITTFWGCLIAAKSFEDILPHSVVLHQGQTAAQALASVLETIDKGKPQIRKVDGLSPRFCEGSIEMCSISFAHPSRSDKLVLQECSFSFPAGQTTFIVGQSGSGKSTVGNLLMRFYAAQKGTITIDGNHIQDIDTIWLRNNITFIQQHCTLFNETIYTNVALGSQEHERVTDAQVTKCLEFAALQSTISDLANGYDTCVGSGGSALSGGQTQRVAIARARLRNAPILILDEATSALDNLSKSSVMTAIRTWRCGKTTIIITHDLDSIRKDDYMYVMGAGRIVQQGRRDTLADLGGDLAANSLRANPGQSSPRRSKPQVLTDQLPSSRAGRWSHMSATTIRADSDLAILQLSQTVLAIGNVGDRLGKGISASTGAALQNLRRESLCRAKAIYSIGPAQPFADMFQETLVEASLNTRNSRNAGSTWTVEISTATDNKPLPVPPFAIELWDTAAPSATVARASSTSMRAILVSVWPANDTASQSKLFLGFLAVLVHAASPPAFSYAIIQIFGTFSMTAGYRQRVLLYSLVVLGIAAVDGLACFAMHHLLESVSQIWVDRLRKEAVRRILQQPKGWFDDIRNRPSLLLASLDHNAENVKTILDRFSAQIVVVVAMMAAALLWSFVTCWKMTLASLAASPILYAVTKSFQLVSSHWERRMDPANAKINDILLETFSDIRTTRSLTLESHFHKKYSAAINEAFYLGSRRAMFSGMFFGISDSAVTLFTSMIFWYGAYLVKHEEWPVKSILTVFALLLFCTASATAVATYIPQTSAATATADRLLRLARMPIISHEDAGLFNLDRHDTSILSGPIHFINQTFYYPSRPEVAVLRRLNLTIPSGKCTAIVGASGSGKSTIAALILGLYPPSTDNFGISDSPPSLTISGRDIRTLNLATLRSLIAIVPQPPVLLPATVRENIIYGLEPGSDLASASRVEASACAAGIHEFIQSLPQGYATIIGDGGLGISGGQAQRIVIARALSRDPKILILDEATSALDHESAETVQKSIIDLTRREGGKLTVIVVTHAQEMMSFADHVVVLDKGSMIEEGSFQDLVNRKGKLWELLKTQKRPQNLGRAE
ncbi:ATP-binding cassette, subfamily B, member 4 [Exophiala viscosa]|uniref:ATP-binding cassette, subfamily B, member 4 n=1 Tax=Exophiala viscosa TaxID=2486360 RepID=A0AAN6DZD9_9EURO|nr:ATP-binding cassette, subfamily B, member 4 [Exophiala viscosa]KAI1622265.1 ATP-binding cassette, subfamily B, member 4 [Exophiala viscosa]